MVSDRASIFVSAFWSEVCAQLGMKRCVSSSYHPQSDGQTERTNRTIVEMLRSYVEGDAEEWDKSLPWVELAYNSSFHESVQSTPFFLNYGEHPRSLNSLGRDKERVPAADEVVKQIEEAVQRAKE